MIGLCPMVTNTVEQHTLRCEGGGELGGRCRDSRWENEADDSAGVGRKDIWESSQARTSGTFFRTE